MYKDFNNKEIINNDLMLHSYDLLNIQGKEYFKNTFGKDTTNVYCAYTVGGDNSLYGYVRLVPRNITQSPLFHNLYLQTCLTFGKENADSISSLNGYQIKDWCLETQFKNSTKLDTFIRLIFIVTDALENKRCLLWAEHNDIPIFSLVDLRGKKDFTIEKEPYIKQIFQI